LLSTLFASTSLTAVAFIGAAADSMLFTVASSAAYFVGSSMLSSINDNNINSSNKTLSREIKFAGVVLLSRHVQV